MEQKLWNSGHHGICILIICLLMAGGVLAQEESWVRKADFIGAVSAYAVTFSTEGRGYIVTGKDIWEYDPAADTWAQKAEMGTTPRTYAIGFSIGSKGYRVISALIFGNMTR
jgi:hypothetical protein